jgi:predicted RNase H-like HicB family nuclease
VSNIVTYVAVVERVPGLEFHVHFPDFPEVRASEATIEGVRTRSGQVLRAHIAQLLQENQAVPRPISLDEVKEEGRYRHGFLITFEVAVPKSRLHTRICRRPGSPSDKEGASTPDP